MLSSMECRRVNYSLSKEKDFLAGGDHQVYCNKAGSFAHEKEQRIVLIGNSYAFKTEYLEIDFGGPLPYVERLSTDVSHEAPSE